MKIIFAGGGTAGHINPALAIAGYIRENEPDAQILFIGNRDGMEQTLVKKAGFDIKSIVISGFKRNFKPQSIVHNVKTVSRAFSSSHDAKAIIREFAPDICVGTGGYVSGPVIRTAMKMGIPCVIHEQNAFPGVTTKVLSKKVDKVMVAVEDAVKHLDGADCVLTGNPIREEILKVDKSHARQELGLDDRPVILSFGGSLGARCINEAVAGLVARSAKDSKYQHIHAYGQQGTWFCDYVKEKSNIDVNDYKNLSVRQYIDNMPQCLAASDLVVCRAGAITLSEIQAKGKPAVLIPSPYVAENHQFHNAMAMVNKKAASIIEEKDLTPEVLIKAVDELVSEPDVLKEYSDNASDMAITDANERIYGIIKDILSADN